MTRIQRVFLTVTFSCVALGVFEVRLQASESNYVRDMADKIISDAHAATERTQVMAIRDYLRSHVRPVNANLDRQPFFRPTAAEVLKSEEGACGEVTRSFIVLADAVGIYAKRLILLDGESSHVVAEAWLSSGEAVIVDALKNPRVQGLEQKVDGFQRFGFGDYSTLNMSRLHLNWLIPSVKLSVGPLSYWLENPHLIKATLWFLISLAAHVARSSRVLVSSPQSVCPSGGGGGDKF